MWYLSIACASIRKTEIMRMMMMEMMMMMSLSLSLKSLEEIGREDDGSNNGVVLAGEVVHLLLLGVGVAPQQLVVLDHLALVADCLHVVLVVVARLKEGALQQLRCQGILFVSQSPTDSRFIGKQKQKLSWNRGSRRMSHSSLRLHSEGLSSNNPL